MRIHKKKLYRFRFLALLLALCLCVPALPAPGAVFARGASGTVIIVTTTEDELNLDGDCSLREAVRAANLDAQVDDCPAGSGLDTILLAAGVYQLTISGASEDQALTGDLDLLDDVIILGEEQTGSIVDGGQIDRVFHVSNNSRVKVIHLTIRNGSAPGGVSESYGGGGILNQSGTLEIENSTLSGNHAVHTGGGIDNAGTALLAGVTLSGNASEDGGGIFNDGTLNMKRVTLSANSASNTGGGLDNSSEATLINVTFSGNSAALQGGGLFNDGNVTLLNSTITDNSTGVANAHVARYKNTLIANSGDKNCTGSGTFTSSGNNLDSDGTCKFNHPSDLSGVQPDLGPLEDNGGGLLTHALQPGSTAIDKGDNLDCPAVDQRGARRPADGNGDEQATCDIGAYEMEGVFPTIVYLTIVTR